MKFFRELIDKVKRHMAYKRKHPKGHKPPPAPAPIPEPAPIPHEPPVVEPTPEPIPEPPPVVVPPHEPDPEPVPEPPPVVEVPHEPPPVIEEPPPVVIPPTPVPVATWSNPVPLLPTGLTNQNIAASGKRVIVVRGDGNLHAMRSTDEAATFGPLVPIGIGKAYLEQPASINGLRVAIISTNVTKDVKDFFGFRPVGDVLLVTSEDGGETFAPQKQITTDAQCLRHSVANYADDINAVWMDYRRGVWDIMLAYSSDFGKSVTETTLVQGTNVMGAQRPVIVMNGNDVFTCWMDGRDNKPGGILDGVQVPTTFEVYGKRKINGTWLPDKRLTTLPLYAGRPAVGNSGKTIVVVFDYGWPNQIWAIQSSDFASSFSAPIKISETTGIATHASVSVRGDVATIAWKENADGSDYARELRNGVLGPIEKVGTASSIPLLVESENYTHLMYKDTSNRPIHRRKARTA